LPYIDETCFCRDSEYLVVDRMFYDDALELSGNEMSYRVKKLLVALVLVTAMSSVAIADGLKGDLAAIADARAMVETMGGIAVWSKLESVHFVHEWDIANRPDRYLENEILDLTGPRSWVTMKSEIYDRVRAYSPEHGYWSVTNGEFSRGSDESLANAMERAPYSIYRLARAVARDDATLHISYGSIDGITGLQALEFSAEDGEPRGWILLNVRKEPIIWATTQYQYVFGPLARFGNLWVPNWATTSNGLVRYEMVSLTGSDTRPDPGLFVVPE
jgi:hypothetical protein